MASMIALTGTTQPLLSRVLLVLHDKIEISVILAFFLAIGSVASVLQCGYDQAMQLNNNSLQP